MYQIHPSKRLNSLFEDKPYQGAHPFEAKFLFLGLDANYAENIENQNIFEQIIEYHENGIKFWQKYGIHHPFLLPEYKGDGKRFHQNFAKISFLPCHATDISFIELLHVPTVGRNRLILEDISPKHIQFLHQAIFQGEAKYIFVNSTAYNLLKKLDGFKALKNSSDTVTTLRVLYQDEQRKIFQHLHFSNYGKFQQQMTMEAKSIFALIQE